jgi:putative heme-binding domain-containing protein
MCTPALAWKRTVAFALVTLGAVGYGLAQERSEPVPQWIWAPQHRAGHIPHVTCYFRKTIEFPSVKQVTIGVAGDDHFELYVNGRRIGAGMGEQGVHTFDLTPHVRIGDNTLAVRVENRQGATAGLAARLVIVDRQNRSTIHVSDASWKASLSPSLLWTRAGYFDGRWRPARQLGTFDSFLANQQARLQQDSGATADDPAGSGSSPTTSTLVASQDGQRPLSRRPIADQELEVPREFTVDQVAGHTDVGSVTAICFGEQGELIVAREDGQLWRLVDANDDQTLDSVQDYGQVLKTCQGILPLNGQLYVTGLGDEGLGLYRLTDVDDDGRLDQAMLIVGFQGDNVEHGPHAVTLGPDGMLYVMVGNHSPLRSAFAATSPYRYEYEGDLVRPRFEDPTGHANGIKAPGGYIMRTDAEGKRIEIVAGGLRNAYDLAFDNQGRLFTHDSDMESDRGTTWYRPTRVYQVIDGAEFGWRSGWSKWPDTHLDSLPGIADTGRGSPTGIVVYNHRAFPAGYQNALFSCDWSEGRIWIVRCTEKGAGLTAEAEVFVHGTPLNVTDIDVAPDGSMYFATGGRGTAGNIYRVSWKGNANQPSTVNDRGIDGVLQQRQLQSGWARQRLADVKQQLGDQWSTQLEQAVEDTSRAEAQRISALQIMQWLGPTPTVTLLTELTRASSPRLRRHAAYHLGLHSDAAALQRLNQLISDRDAVVRRIACEGLARHAQPVELDSLVPCLTSADRFESWAARRVLETTPRALWQNRVLTGDDARQFLVGATALVLASPDADTAQAVLGRSLQWMEGFLSDEDFVDLLRLQQVALLRGNLQPADVPELRKQLAEEYPSSSATINRELIRLLIYLQVDWIVDRYVKELERDGSSADQLHLAMHLSFLKSGWNTPQKMTVFQSLAAPSGSGNSVPGYLQNAALQLGAQMNDEERELALQRGYQSPGAALAALLRMPDRLSAEQLTQIQQLDRQLEGQEGESIRRLRIAIVAILARDGGSPASRYLRQIYDADPTRRVEVAMGLAATEHAENWPYLVRSLPILDPGDAREMLVKLRGIRQWPKDAESYRQVILTAQRLADDGAADAISLLEHWQGYAPNSDSPPWQTALEAWKRWFKDEYPDQPVPELLTSGTEGKWDEQALLKHLGRAEQDTLGSVTNGKAVFAKAQCASCHRFGGEGESMGPDLTGVGKRFLKREILDAMLYPSKVISDQYAAKIVSTSSGTTYTGIVAAGVGDELVILQSNGTKIRLPAVEVDEMERSGVSAMPEGLLDALTLEEITDLFAYLLSDAEQLTQAAGHTAR